MKNAWRLRHRELWAFPLKAVNKNDWRSWRWDCLAMQPLGWGCSRLLLGWRCAEPSSPREKLMEPFGLRWSHRHVQQWQGLSLCADQRCLCCSWSDSDRSWSKCLRGIRGISSKIRTRHHQPIPKVEYCCRRKVWLLAKLTVSLCKIMFLAYYFKIYKEAWNSPWITTVKGLLLFFLWPNQVQGGSFQPGSVSHYGVYIVIIARNKGQHLQRRQALNVDFPRRFYLQIVIKGLHLFHWKKALLEFGLRWHLLSLVTFACELSPF